MKICVFISASLLTQSVISFAIAVYIGGILNVNKTKMIAVF